ncbi:MAG: type II/IV secretion system protein [Magnetococcales bacterium]|nr:type II/IV secretion system protein [Magnetococcales bacterium]
MNTTTSQHILLDADDPDEEITEIREVEDSADIVTMKPPPPNQSAPAEPVKTVFDLYDATMLGSDSAFSTEDDETPSNPYLGDAPDLSTITRKNKSKKQLDEDYWKERRGLGRNWVEICLNADIPQAMIDAGLLERRSIALTLDEAQETGRTFFTILMLRQTTEKVASILKLIEEKLKIKFILDENNLMNDIKATSWLSYDKALELGMVALEPLQENRSRYATYDPFNLENLDWFERCSGFPADVVMTTPELLKKVILRRKEIHGDDESQKVGLSTDFSAEEERNIREQSDKVDVPMMVNYFLFSAYKQRASDIHIEAGEKLMMVRNRVDGILHTEITLPMQLHSEIVSRLKILCDMNVAEKRHPQDGRFSTVILRNPIDVRVSSYPTEHGEKFVLRLLDKNLLSPIIDTMGFLDRDLKLLKTKIEAPHGLIMISGPTGSGKTTTLYSCLGSIDKAIKNVLTVEDPVEYRLPGVHQMQVNQKIDLTFAKGLRSILRQDPDVIMVGEIRDDETAAMAVQAALTGHVVFSTIHTNDAVGVVTRLMDMKVKPYLIATALSLAIAQRLIRTICPNCRISVGGERMLELLFQDGITAERLAARDITIDPDDDYYLGAGCERCLNTGYSGRQPVFEMFEMTNEARDLIISGHISGTKLKQIARDAGMKTLIEHGMHLVKEQKTTLREVIRLLGEEV